MRVISTPDTPPVTSMGPTSSCKIPPFKRVSETHLESTTQMSVLDVKYERLFQGEDAQMHEMGKKEKHSKKIQQ